MVLNKVKKDLFLLMNVSLFTITADIFINDAVEAVEFDFCHRHSGYFRHRHCPFPLSGVVLLFTMQIPFINFTEGKFWIPATP